MSEIHPKSNTNKRTGQGVSSEESGTKSETLKLLLISLKVKLYSQMFLGTRKKREKKAESKSKRERMERTFFHAICSISELF